MAVCCLVASPNLASAQMNEDLYIYGYFQGITRYSHLESNPLPEVEEAWSFSIQQMNLFMFKQFDANFSAFVNLEITNSLSTVEGWGGIALDEAWMKYQRNNALKIKAGLLIPTFNNLNAIKNKTPLLPYIMRPFAYETIVEEFFSTNELVPKQAAVEVYGSKKINKRLKLDYAAYVGNNSAFITSETAATIPSGGDTTLVKLVGGRVGLRRNSVKVGVSVSRDEADLSKIPIFLATDLTGIGKASRTRLGVDLSFSTSRFFFESEFIRVFYSLADSDKELIREFISINPLLSEELDKLFAYGSLGINIGERFFAYGMYSYMEDRSNIITDEGFGMYSVGGGFRPNDSLVFKLQFVHVSTYAKDLFFGRETDVLIGLSVYL